MSDEELLKERGRILSMLGGTLLLVQGTENVIRHCMTWVLPKANVNSSIEALESQIESYATKTLGHFIQQLRYRADLAAEFDVELTEFLALRNQLVHHFDEVPGISLSTPEGREIAERFIANTANMAGRMTNIFLALIPSPAD